MAAYHCRSSVFLRPFWIFRCPLQTRTFASSRFLSFEESRDYIRGLGFRKQEEFLQWCRIGKRPEFIHSNPQQFYRGNGWISFPDYFGYERSKKESKPRSPDSERANVCHKIPIAERQTFVDFVMQNRRDIQLRSLPFGLKATHLFRCIGGGGRSGISPAGLWMPVQIRFAGRVPQKTGLHSVTHTAEAGTGVIILCANRCFFAGRREELKTCFRVRDCVPWEKVFHYFDVWWQTAELKSEFELMQALPSHVARSRLWRDYLVDLNRVYCQSLKLSITAPESSSDKGATFILDGHHRIKARVANNPFRTYSRDTDMMQATIGPVAPGTTDFDFLLVFFPDDLLPMSGNDGDKLAAPKPSFFMFPRQYLLQAGIIPGDGGDAFSSGTNKMNLFPPFKLEKKRKTTQRKAEQAQYWVDSVEKLEDLLRRFGRQGGTCESGIGSISEITVSCEIGDA